MLDIRIFMMIFILGKKGGIMRRIYPFILVVLLLVITIGTVISQEKQGPRITIEEPNFDFGFAPEGTFMAHEYVIKNTGDEPLEIKRVRTTCGCTSAPIKKMHLEPGEETTITIIFNSTRYFHKTSKAAIISTNDPTRPSEKITFIANMDTVKPRAITPKPRKIDLGNVNDFHRVDSVKIQNLSENDVTIQIVDYYEVFLEEPWIVGAKTPIIEGTSEGTDEPQYSAISIPVGGTATIKVSVRDDISPEEIIRASFTVSAMDKGGNELTRITVPVFGGGE